MVDVEVSWNGHQITGAARRAGAGALTTAAHRVQAVTVPRTPIETGDLRSSITVVPANERDLTAEVVTRLPYAAKQHEDLTLRHPNGGQAKFLESALIDTADEVAAIIATRLRSELGGAT